MAHSRAPRTPKRVFVAVLNGLAARRAPPAAVENGDVRQILVVELWNIGDVVLMLPFLAQLRAIFPGAAITLLARPHARVILEGTGLIDNFIDDATPADNWLSLNPMLGGWRDLWRLRKRLRQERFDLAFQCRLHAREHVILAMSGASRRIGYAFGEGDRMLTDAIPVDNLHRHKVDDWTRLLAVVGGPVVTASPNLHVSEEDRETACRFLAENGIATDEIVIGIHPGASLPEKRWPLDRFCEVARELALKPGVRVIAFADPAGYGESLGYIDGVISAKTTLRELIALMERCSLLVCNDSGPMHLAGGLGVPTVAFFGSGVARWFAPLGDGHELITAGESGIQSIPPSSVLDAVERVLAAT